MATGVAAAAAAVRDLAVAYLPQEQAQVVQLERNPFHHQYTPASCLSMSIPYLEK